MKTIFLKDKKGRHASPLVQFGSVYDSEGKSLVAVVEEVKDELDKKADKGGVPKAKPSAFAISPDMYDLVLDPTKGVAPYNTAYGYTNITIHEDAGVEWVEGGIYSITVKDSRVTAAYRNGRVRIGEDGEWYPIATAATNQIITVSNILTPNQTSVMVFKKNYYPKGALHVVYDTNTTYTAMTQTELNTGTATTGRTVTAKFLSDNFVKKISDLEDKMDEVYDDYLTADSLL